MLEVIRKLGSIQFDPIAVAGRNHDLVLHARVAGYEPAWCDVLYERREIFETTNKALSLVPASEFPWFRLGFGRKGPRFHARILAENAVVAERVLGRIRAEGALSALDFEPEHGAPKDWFGMPENVVRAVLEAYTVTGAIGLARREGNRRYYDLLERLLPAELLAHEVPVREQLRHKLLSRYRAHGLLGTGGTAFDRIATERPGRNALREELVELGALVRVGLPPRDGEGALPRRPVTEASRVRAARRSPSYAGSMPDHYRPPGWFTRNVFNKLVAFLTRRGISVLGSRVLAVKGRTSGQWRTTPVNLLTHDGRRYLVAPRGEAQWVRNLRAAGTGELRVGRRTESFRGRELADDEKVPVLRAYLRRWKAEVGIFFEGTGPDSSDDQLRAIAPKHPAFEVLAVD